MRNMPRVIQCLRWQNLVLFWPPTYLDVDNIYPERRQKRVSTFGTTYLPPFVYVDIKWPPRECKEFIHVVSKMQSQTTAVVAQWSKTINIVQKLYWNLPDIGLWLCLLLFSMHFTLCPKIANIILKIKLQTKQAPKGFEPPSAMFVIFFWNFLELFGNFFGNFSGGFFGGLLWRNFFGGIVWEKRFGKIFWGGFFWEEFFWEEFFWEHFWEEFNKKLFEYGSNLFVCKDFGFCQDFGLRKGR